MKQRKLFFVIFFGLLMAGPIAGQEKTTGQGEISGQLSDSISNLPLLTVDRLNERIKKGKDTTYVVNFWATWCAPCIKEIPHFEKLQEEKKSNKLKVLLVSLDFKDRLEKSVIPFVKRQELRNEVFLLDEADQQEYIDRIDKSWSGAIPATLFVRGDKRKFIEKEFTYPTLLNEYQHFK